MSEPIKVYGKRGCPYTRALLRKLDHEDRPHLSYDVEQEPRRLHEMLMLNGGRGEVPTIVWPDKGVEVGFHGT
jgi:glutaredoxin 3